MGAIAQDLVVEVNIVLTPELIVGVPDDLLFEKPQQVRLCSPGTIRNARRSLSGRPPVSRGSRPRPEMAIAKVREIMATQDPLPAGLRIGVVGGGCSGFQYSMAFENQSGMMDKVFNFDDLKVFIDATSLMYLNGCTVDYVETLEAAGFKFENPQVKSTCGCGSSFSV